MKIGLKAYTVEADQRNPTYSDSNRDVASAHAGNTQSEKGIWDSLGACEKG
jgi:hypothetical protein